jgi:hypothetical protein
MLVLVLLLYFLSLLNLPAYDPLFWVRKSWVTQSGSQKAILLFGHLCW